MKLCFRGFWNVCASGSFRKLSVCTCVRERHFVYCGIRIDITQGCVYRGGFIVLCGWCVALPKFRFTAVLHTGGLAVSHLYICLLVNILTLTS